MTRARVLALARKEWLDLRRNPGALLPVALVGVVEHQPADAIADIGEHKRFVVRHPSILACDAAVLLGRDRRGCQAGERRSAAEAASSEA